MSAEGGLAERISRRRGDTERGAWDKWTEFTEFFGQGGRWRAACIRKGQPLAWPKFQPPSGS
jgi:hypothetical protein